MFFNLEQTEQAMQASPLMQPREPVLPKVIEGFAIGWVATKVLKKVAPIPTPWPGR